MANLGLCDIYGLVPQLEKDDVLGVGPAGLPVASCVYSGRQSCCGGRCWRGRAGAQSKAEAAAAVEPGQSVADQHRVALVKAHPQVYVAQSY